MGAALYALRAASALFPQDETLRAIPLYVRHNRATCGTLQPGDPLPDLELHSPAPGDDVPTTALRAACAKPTLIVAGSFT